MRKQNVKPEPDAEVVDVSLDPEHPTAPATKVRTRASLRTHGPIGVRYAAPAIKDEEA